MNGARCAVFVVVVTFLQGRTRGDAEVSCVFMERCILPCSFQNGDRLVIHWILLADKNIPVHSYYDNIDQLKYQDQHFKNRTSLFKDQISGGNASLQLTGVRVQDQGRYKCYTGSDAREEQSFIKLNVDAPVRKVDIQQVENRITCSSEGIYPEPELTWSTNVTPQNKTSVQQTEQQLYNISSSAMVSDTDPLYSCTVSTRRNKRKATWFQPTSVSTSDGETTINCTSTNAPLTGLVWRFNHSQVILNRTGPDAPYRVSEEWKEYVKKVSESGSLTLKTFSPDQEGMYSCELSDVEETNVTNTFLKIIEDQIRPSAIAGGVVGGLVLIAVVAFCIWRWYRGRTGNPPDGQQANEQQANGQQETLPLRTRTEPERGQSSAEMETALNDGEQPLTEETNVSRE